MHIQRKGQAGKPLSSFQYRRNRRIDRVRARLEHVIASLEQMGSKALRSIGLARATLHLNWKAATCNLRRLYSLIEMGPTPFHRPTWARSHPKGQLRALEAEYIAPSPFDKAVSRSNRAG